MHKIDDCYYLRLKIYTRRFCRHMTKTKEAKENENEQNDEKLLPHSDKNNL